MQSSDEDRAAELLERLLTDEAFRASFRRDPAAACRDADLPDLAGEFGAGGGNKMLHTLEIRESRSSLAGAFMAAASEGTGAVDHLRRMHESSTLPGDAHRVVHKALTSPKLQAVDPNAIQPQGGIVDQLSDMSGGGTPAPLPVASPDDVAPLLDSPQLSLSPEAYAALARGGADTRLVSVLEDLTQSHRLRIGTIQTTGGAGGDTLEILAVDGERVSPGNIAARDLANELASLDPSLRPAQIVTPWPIDGDGFSTGQYDDRIQIVFGAPPAPPPPETATPSPPQQSLVLGAVNEPQSRSTLHFQAPIDHAGGLGTAAAFDPNLASALPDAGDTYPGDNASKDAIAAWMGRQAHKAGLPAELPIMAALTESGLQNVSYGDRDSLGFFQMRTSIWNQGEYAGFSDHPELQLKWFIDHALAVRQERIAQGDTAYGQDRSKWGDWVADVEQPAAEYRGRYETHLEEADSLLTSGGGGGAAGAADAAAAMQSAYAAGGSAVGVQALQIAERYMGTPYKWGGASPETGFDCSGLVQWSYEQLGIDLPRVTDQQFQVGVHISNVDDLRPGDIVFFRDSTGYIHHEGMYIGNHQFVHAPHTGDVIKISSLDEPYYKEQFAGGSDVSGLAAGGGGAVPPPPPPPPVPEAAPATPAPPDPAAATPGGGTGESGLFGAVPEPGSGSGDPATPDPGSGSSSPGSTVQILPAVKDPNETT